jgi:hypothetical protein
MVRSTDRQIERFIDSSSSIHQEKVMPFNFSGFERHIDRFNEQWDNILPSEPTKSAAPPPDQPESPRPAEPTRAVPVSFSQSFNSSGSWQVYNPTNAGNIVREIRPLTQEERWQFEAMEIDLENAREATVAGLTALVKGHQHASTITREVIEARVKVAEEDLKTGQTLSNGVVSMMELAPGWAKAKAALGTALGESAHKQKLTVAQVTGQLYAALGQ